MIKCCTAGHKEAVKVTIWGTEKGELVMSKECQLLFKLLRKFGFFVQSKWNVALRKLYNTRKDHFIWMENSKAAVSEGSLILQFNQGRLGKVNVTEDYPNGWDNKKWQPKWIELPETWWKRNQIHKIILVAQLSIGFKNILFLYNL